MSWHAQPHAVDASVFASSAPLTAQRLGHLATHWPAWTIISCRGAAAGENASDAVAFTVFRRVAALVPRVRVDATVHRLLGGSKCESRSQNQLHFEVLRARLMQQTFRRDFALLESMLSGPEIDGESPLRPNKYALTDGVGFWPQGLRTAIRTPTDLRSRH